jgi:hypothetical protein
VFVGSFDEWMEGKVSASADGLADTLLANPGKVEEIITVRAREIAASANIKTPETTLEKLKPFARRIKNELKEIKETSQKVTALLEEKSGEIAAKRQQEEEAEQRRAETRGERPFDSGLAPCYCIKNGISTYVGMRTSAM